MTIKVKDVKAKMSSTYDLINEVHPGLAAHIASSNKKFGENSLYWFKRDAEETTYDAWSTGRFMLDNVLGNRGFVRGRIAEIYGPESCGKTTLCLDLVAESQLLGGIDQYVDAEHTVDPELARNNGVSREFMLFSQPNTGEEGLNLTNDAVKSGVVSNVHVDSVDGLVPKVILEGVVGDVTVGAHARMMSQALRLINKSCAASGVNVFFINQIRDKISTSFSGFGGPQTTTGGGRALKFYASYRLEMAKIGQIKQNGEMIGQRCKIKLVKNKTAPPFGECEMDLYFWPKENLWGFSKAADMFDTGLTLGLINASGVRVYNKSVRLANGRLASILELHNNPEKFKAIRDDLKRRLGYTTEFVFNRELVGKLFVVPESINTFALSSADDDAPAIVIDEESPDAGKKAMLDSLKNAFKGMSQEDIDAMLANSKEIKTIKIDDDKPIDFQVPEVKVEMPADPEFDITEEDIPEETEQQVEAKPEDSALASEPFSVNSNSQEELAPFGAGIGNFDFQ